MAKVYELTPIFQKDRCSNSENFDAIIISFFSAFFFMRLAGKLFTADQRQDPRRVGQTKLAGQRRGECSTRINP